MGLLPNRLIEAAERGANAIVRLADAAEVIALELRLYNEIVHKLEWDGGSLAGRFYSRVRARKDGPR